MRYRLVPLAALSGLVFGCGVTVNYHRLNPSPTDMAPRAGDTVAVYTTTRPPYPYVDVGMLEVRQESYYSTASESDVFAALRREAARRGCDGLIVMGAADAVASSPIFNNSPSSSLLGGGSITKTLHGYRATCIVEAPVPVQHLRPRPPVAAASPPPPRRPDFVDPFAQGSGLEGVPAPAPARAATVACDPLCSPGYECRGGSCLPTCNPPCGADQACGADRTCRRP
jgi:hypothetical protein